MRALIDNLHLHTICESAYCPNRQDCFTQQTAAFLILGDICTRNCSFCAVKTGQPDTPDIHEPEHIVEAVKKLNLHYVVITSVTRDDLPDGGASHFYKIIKAIKQYDPGTNIEVLVPDFKDSLSALRIVVSASPIVLNHNIETVPRLYSTIRRQASYYRSIRLLKRAKLMSKRLFTKSGLILGLGEERQEVIAVMEELRGIDCDFLTLGQYLQPSSKNHEVVRFLHPLEFSEYKTIGEKMGFKSVISAPLVRSSFRASECLKDAESL
jgi:lipoic acid synthetase